MYDVMSATPDGDIEIELEGNFNTTFTLYAPKNYDIQIREIFQPDFMTMLIDQCSNCIIEISNNRLHILTPTITNKQEFLKIHDLIDTLFTHIIPYLTEVAQSD